MYRDRLDPVVQMGGVRCARGKDCDRAELDEDGSLVGGFIKPGEAWHLDHKDDGVGWLGPSHATCNTRAGAQKMHDANANGSRVFVEQPYRWSRRWHDDPPLGTTCAGEVYVGNGVWVEAPGSRARANPSKG